MAFSMAANPDCARGPERSDNVPVAALRRLEACADDAMPGGGTPGRYRDRHDMRLKKQPDNSSPRGTTASPFINPDAPSGPGPEPSLAMRMARATIDDALQTGASPFDSDTRGDEATQPPPARTSASLEPWPVVELGGRVDAVRATYGRGDRAGAAAAGIPVQSVGAAMTTPGLPGFGVMSRATHPAPSTHAPERGDEAEADPL